MTFETYNPRKQIRKDAITMTIGLGGNFGLSPLALDTIGRPSDVVVQYDREEHKILVRPPRYADEPRLRVTRDPRKNGRDGGHMAGSGFCKQFALTIRQVIRMVGRQEGDGVVFALPPEAWPKEGQDSPNGQRSLERALV